MIRDAAIAGRHDHARRGRAREGQVRRDDRRGAASASSPRCRRCARCARAASAAVGVDFMACPHCGHRLNAGCPKCGRSLQAGWQFCPYLHDEHDGQADRRSSCAISGRRRSFRRRTSLNSRIRTIVEELLRLLGRCRRARRRDQEGVPARDRALPPGQGPASRHGVPGDGGSGDRRRSDRGVPDPDGSGAARASTTRICSADEAPARARAPQPPVRPPTPVPQPPPPAHRPAARAVLRRPASIAASSSERATTADFVRKAGRCRACATRSTAVTGGAAGAPDRGLRHGASTSKPQERPVQEGGSARPPARASSCRRWTPRRSRTCWPLAVKAAKAEATPSASCCSGPGHGAGEGAGGRHQRAAAEVPDGRACARPGRCERLGGTVSPGTPASVRALVQRLREGRRSADGPEPELSRGVSR